MKGRDIKEYYVFLASPGDVSTERQIVKQFFTEYETGLVNRGRPERFRVIDWENYHGEINLMQRGVIVKSPD